MKQFLSIILVLGISSVAMAQQPDRTGLNYGVKVGWGWHGNAEAQMYACGPNNNVNLSSILIGNTTNYTKLKEYYNDDFTLYELPQNISYSPTLNVGGTLQYYVCKTFAIYFDGVYSAPTIKNSNFSIKLNSKKGSISNEVIEQGSIHGKESRLDLALGLHKTFQNGTNYQPFVGLAFVSSFLQMKSHEIAIGNLKQSVLNYSTENADNKFSKVGLGASCNAGVQFPISDKCYIYAGLKISAIHYGITNQTLSYAKGIDFSVLL